MLKNEDTKKVVVFGGGTGLSNLLLGLKKQPLEITVVVTIADNGGSTGKIRSYYDIPAPGDLRRAVVALSDYEEAKTLMNYRFDQNVENHTVGNLILAAFNNIKGDMTKAVKAYCRLLNVPHNIVPISNESLTLSAVMEDGQIVHGETQISNAAPKISEIFYDGKPHLNEKVVEAVNEADAVIFSPGSLYTSLIPNLVFPELKEILARPTLKKVYVANLVTQSGETDGYKLSDHEKAINKHLENSKIDYILANNNYKINQQIINRYADENSEIVFADKSNINAKLILKNYIKIDKNKYLRHNVTKIGLDITYLLSGGFDEKIGGDYEK